ncbi:universal stress protein [Salinirubrum litoreum]|uniref:Universal stress protein n=1 Tax=Salinirubrum litoreum TaxID=1126234 RepID=A0ABD5RG96_9EURY|nr:universal stress protein [Salinirubrum litoreum]
MPERVLVPFDGSPLSEKALDYACETFGSTRITVLYVVDSHRDDTAATGWGDHPSEWDDWLDDRREHAEELFVTARAVASEHDVDVETGVAVGRVVEAIIDAIDFYDADLLVMGTHGRSHLEEFVLGSVAESLVRRSPVPVTTVR